MSTHLSDCEPVSGRARREAAAAQLFERMAETGHLASECGLHAEAECIFVSLVLARRGHPSPRIGLAIVRSCAGRLEQAIADARQIAADHPDSDMAKAVLGMFLSQSGSDEAEALFCKLLADGSDPAAMQIAHLCIADDAPAPAAQETESLEYFRHHNVRP